MSDILLSPPIAFLIYILVAGIIYLIGRVLAGPTKSTAIKSSTYSSGEAPPKELAAPGYQPFFVVALFFAILHLGVLVIGSGGFTVITGLYLAGLIIALLALILG